MKKLVFSFLQEMPWKKGLFLSACLFCTVTALAAFIPAILTSLEFYQEGEESVLALSLNQGDVQYKKTNVLENKQIIIDLESVTASERVMRSFVTSEFSGSVVMVSAYKKPKTQNDLRIIIQLRDNVRSVVVREDLKILIKIENRFGAFNDGAAQVLAEKTDLNMQEYHVPRSNSVEDLLENLTFSGAKKYAGKKISFNVKNIPLEDFLRMLADTSGFNIIVDDLVRQKPPLTLNLTNIPWDQALDTVLELYKLAARKNGPILTVTTIEKAMQLKKEEMDLAEQAKAKEPLLTKIFPLSYAEIDATTTLITEYIDNKNGAKISKDVRTNSLIVKDTAENLEKIRKIIETLDTQTPQILIESKIVEVTESFSRQIGLNNGFQFGYDPAGSQGDRLSRGNLGESGAEHYITGPGFTFSSAPGPMEGRFQGLTGMGLSIGRLGRVLDLNFQLQLMEEESKGKVITSPKVITQNKKQATISSTDSVSVKVSNMVDGVATTNYEKTDATLQLQVTPQVTNDGGIIMDINVTKTSLDMATMRANADQGPGTSQRTVTTNVLVDSGSTIVIGGIYTQNKSHNVAGIPFLKDLPYVGWLFRSADNPVDQKSEMMIFLTPRIINQEEAGMIQAEVAG